MDVNITGFERLFETLRGLDLIGQGPPGVPWGRDEPTAAAVLRAVSPALPVLPRVYRDGYGAPLVDSLDVLIRRVGPDVTLVEALAGAVYDHESDEVRPRLQEFLAVLSNMYRSFLSSRKRANANVPAAEQLPPLAVFQHAGDNGPFTLPVDATQQLFGSSVGVVSLPSVYRDHPLLWGSLAHECGGHDVLHADENLLPELREGVQRMFGGGSVGAANSITMSRFLGLLWSYWMDEAASDVYGVLNIGPSFGLNLAVFFAALNAEFTNSTTPRLRTASGANPQTGDLDPHPTDILRLDLIRGAVDSLVGLSQETRTGYTEALDQLSALCGGDTEAVTLQGTIVTPNGSGIRVNTRAPMAAMKAAARTVGSFIASSLLTALGGRGIQDIETWDNPDETAAQMVMRALLAGESAVQVGDDAQLLAGATLAAFVEPDDYRAISTGLAAALHDSWDRDPIWSIPRVDPARLDGVVVDEKTYGASVAVGWT